MKHRWMHIAGILAVVLVFALVLGACENGAQEVKMHTTGKPNVEISLASNFGVKLTWEDVVGAKHFEIWRSEGELPMEILYKVERHHKDKFGKFVYYDIVDYTDYEAEEQYSTLKGWKVIDETPTLESNTEYRYQVVAVPVVTSREFATWEGKIKTGTIAEEGKLPAPTGSITLDGENRTITWTITPPANPLPGIKVKTSNYGFIRMPIQVRGGGYAGAQYSVIINIDDFAKGAVTKTIKYDDAPATFDAAFRNDYGSFQSEYPFGVAWTYFLLPHDSGGNANVGNFNNPADKDYKIGNAWFGMNNSDGAQTAVPNARFESLFTVRANTLTATFTEMASEVTLFDNSLETVITSVAAKASSINNPAQLVFDAGRRVVNLQAEIDISDVLGLEGQTYYIERTELDAKGKYGVWEDITDKLTKIEYQDISTTTTAVMHPFFVPLSDDLDELKTDIFGNFPVVIFYDRTLPVKKAEYAYRIRAGSGRAMDWISNRGIGGYPTLGTSEIKATVTNALINFTIGYEMLEAGIALDPANDTDDEAIPNSIAYKITPQVSKIGVLGDDDYLEVYFMRSRGYQVGGFIPEQRHTFNKAELESGTWKGLFDVWFASTNTELVDINVKADIADYDDYVLEKAIKEFHLASPDPRNGLDQLFVQAFVHRGEQAREVVGVASSVPGFSDGPFAVPSFDNTMSSVNSGALEEIIDVAVHAREVLVRLRYHEMDDGSHPYYGGGDVIEPGYWPPKL